MKLKVYNRSNSAILRKGKATIRVNSKSGTIAFSQSAASAIGMTKDTGFEIAQDENRLQDWYITKSDNENSFYARENSSGRGGFVIQSVVLSKAILESVSAGSNSASFLVATEPIVHEGVEFYAILTKSMQVR